MKLAKHAPIGDWVDYVRGIGGASNLAAMEAHLSSGCQRCLTVVRALQRVVTAAAEAAAVEPPIGVVRRAQAIYPLYRPETTVLARLIYDSFREPVPAGMRGLSRPARHALYAAGDFYVDLQLEHEASSGSVTLVGQISDSDHPRINTTTLPILLFGRRSLVASAMCNRLGEFEMKFRPARDLRLLVPLRETGVHVDLRIDELWPVPQRRRRRVSRGRRRRAMGKLRH